MFNNFSFINLCLELPCQFSLIAHLSVALKISINNALAFLFKGLKPFFVVLDLKSEHCHSIKDECEIFTFVTLIVIFEK